MNKKKSNNNNNNKTVLKLRFCRLVNGTLEFLCDIVVLICTTDERIKVESLQCHKFLELGFFPLRL